MNTPPLDIEALWNKYSEGEADEHLKFERVKERLSNRPDLHAFILLGLLCPGTEDIIGSSQHDEFYLSISPQEIAKVATEEQIIDLIRCGLRYDSQNEAFCMFA